MKKKTFAWAVLPIAALLAACGSPATSSSSAGTSTPATTTSEQGTSTPATTSEQQPSTPTVTSEEQPSTPTETSEEQPSTPTETSAEQSVPEVIEHLDAYTAVDEAAEVRKFDERFDVPVDDFSGATIAGVTDGTRHNGFLRALVDSAVDGFPKTTDGAVYKAASGTYEAMNFGANGIGFRMRVSRGKVGLKNLRLELRGGDAFQTYPIQLTEAMNSDNEALPELTDEYQDFLINPGQTIEDENTVYKNVDGTDSDTTVLGHILGFHLVANDIEVGGELEICEVFTYSGTNRVVLDDFNREDVAKVPNAWWGGSASGFIVRRGVTLNNGKKYTTPALEGHTHLAFSLLGDTSGTVLKGLDAQGTVLASINWGDAKGKDATLKAAANGAYGNYVVELGQLVGNGILAKVEISSTTPIELSNVFLTSLEVPQLNLQYPHINASVYMDEFAGDIASLDDNWDASAAKEVNKEAGRNGFVSYAMGDQISVSNGALNLPAADNYAQVTIGYQSTHIDDRAKYIVFAAKGDDLSLLRFKFRGKGSDSEVYFNAALAAEGVKAYNDPNVPSPYVDKNGFTHYVIDLALNGLAVGDIFDLYYTGPSAVQISSIYFAVDLFPTTAVDYATPVASHADLSGYTYVGGMPAAPGQLLAVLISGSTGDADLSTFRVKMGNEVKWFKDGQIKAYNDYYRPLLPTDKIPETGGIVIFDLSAFSSDVEHYVHFETGLENASGSIEIAMLGTFDRSYNKSFGGGNAVEVNKTYQYLGGFEMDASYDYLKITLKASGTNMTYNSFRIASPETSFAFANNPETFSAVHADGTPVVATDVIPEEGETIIVDVAKSNITLTAGEKLHIHYADWGDPVGTIQVTDVTGTALEYPYELILLPA